MGLSQVPVMRQVRSLYGSALQTSSSVRRLEDAVRRLETIQRTQPTSPVEQFISMSYATRRDGLFDGTYDLWRVKRISKILEIFGIDHFHDRSVLELGAGHGDIGALLANLGAEVTCVEGRDENLNFGKLKHREVKRLTFRKMDLEQDFRSLGSFDVVLNLGLLYHVQNVDEHLGWCFELTDDLVLESVVCDSTDPHKVFVIDENAELNEEALNGRGSRPSPFYIERLAGENGFDVERYFSADLNSDHYVYDWEHRDNDDLGGFEQRRFWRMRRR
jgi:SAM-dependent methyltransferase